MDSLQDLINRANKVEYTKPVKFINDCNIPKSCLSDCKRIVQIFKDYEGVGITEQLAYQLWHTHSETSFCAGWECMEMISDEVIYETLLSMIKNVEV